MLQDSEKQTTILIFAVLVVYLVNPLDHKPSQIIT